MQDVRERGSLAFTLEWRRSCPGSRKKWRLSNPNSISTRIKGSATRTTICFYFLFFFLVFPFLDRRSDRTIISLYFLFSALNVTFSDSHIKRRTISSDKDEHRYYKTKTVLDKQIAKLQRKIFQKSVQIPKSLTILATHRTATIWNVFGGNQFQKFFFLTLILNCIQTKNIQAGYTVWHFTHHCQIKFQTIWNKSAQHFDCTHQQFLSATGRRFLEKGWNSDATLGFSMPRSYYEIIKVKQKWRRSSRTSAVGNIYSRGWKFLYV